MIALDGLIIDLFAGAGGVSFALRDVYGRDPDVAINHDATAVAVHAANHPNTLHLHGDVWHYAPLDVTKGRRVGHLHASPTCTFFSQAKGAPLDRWEATRVRALAWVVVRWAREAAPDLITVENVPPFENWGPLDTSGKPREERRGSTFRRWVRALERAGYTVAWRVLTACDYGSPTSRRRLFVVARRDGLPISWPEPTHGPGTGAAYRGARDVIDWSIPAPSIFGRKRPLAVATLRRVARGITRFALDAADPFIIPVSHAGDARVHAVEEPVRTITASSRSPLQLVIPSLVHVSNGERVGQAPRIYDVQEPLSTVVAGGVKQGLVVCLVKNFGGHEGSGLDARTPIGTVTTQDHHALVACSTFGGHETEVRELLLAHGPRVVRDDGVISVRVGRRARDFVIADIGMRLLVPRELARAHDFEEMVLERDVEGRPVTKTDQVRLIGNSVPRKLAAAVIGANAGARGRVAA